MVVETSILKSTKKVLGLADDYTPFDEDVIMHINSAFSNTSQIGVTLSTFSVEDDSVEWSSLNLPEVFLSLLKTYVVLYVRLIFDPPSTSFHIEAIEKQRDENFMRMSYLREGLSLNEGDVPTSGDIDYASGTQSSPSTLWLMVHNLGYNPAAFRFFDEDDNEMEPETITYPTLNTALATWPDPVPGSWMCS